MKQARITIINASVSSIKDKRTNTTNELTKICYSVERTNTDKMIGQAILTCYRQGNLLKKLEPYTMKSTMAHIREDFLENGNKWVLVKVDNVEL